MELWVEISKKAIRESEKSELKIDGEISVDSMRKSETHHQKEKKNWRITEM